MFSRWPPLRGFVGARIRSCNRLLGEIRTAMGTTGVISATPDPQHDRTTSGRAPGNQIEKQPVIRLDYNLSDNHRLSGVYNWQVVTRDPDHLNNGDVRFPGAANYARYVSYRPLASGTLRSTVSSNLVNELRGGLRWGPGYFGQVDSNGPETFAGSDGFAVDFAGRRPGPHQLAPAERPELAQRLELEHRRHAHLAERQAQHELRHVALLRQRAGRTTRQSVPGHHVRRSRPTIRRRHCSTGRTSPARPPRARPTRRTCSRCSPAASTPTPARPCSAPRRGVVRALRHEAPRRTA